MSAKPLIMVVAVATVAMVMPAAADARKPKPRPVVHELATFAAPDCAGGCGSGSTIGPDGALYVTDGPGGRVLRVDPQTGADHDVRERPAAGDPRGRHRRCDRCRLPRSHRVCARHLGRPRLRPARHRQRHLPDREGRQRDRRSPISAPGRSRTRPRPTSSCPAASSTRCRRSVAGCWSLTGTTTACCTSLGDGDIRH